jgi:hypothetical protein
MDDTAPKKARWQNRSARQEQQSAPREAKEIAGYKSESLFKSIAKSYLGVLFGLRSALDADISHPWADARRLTLARCCPFPAAAQCCSQRPTTTGSGRRQLLWRWRSLKVGFVEPPPDPKKAHSRLSDKSRVKTSNKTLVRPASQLPSAPFAEPTKRPGPTTRGRPGSGGVKPLNRGSQVLVCMP